MKFFLVSVLAVGLGVVAQAQKSAKPDWRALVKREMPVMGHRNWIVIADSAYPEQVSPGVITIYTGQSQIATVREVMKILAGTRHVTPDVFLDSELKYLTDAMAPGISRYKAQLKQAFGTRPTQSMLHEKLISTLDESGKTFRVIILKTTLTLPYTSVFLRLNCAYWGDVKDAKLRAVMPKQ